MAKAQEEGAELKPIPLPYEMELVEMKIKDKKFVKIMQGKEPSQVRGWHRQLLPCQQGLGSLLPPLFLQREDSAAFMFSFFLFE